MSFEGPRRRIVHAFGSWHLVRKVKYLQTRVDDNQFGPDLFEQSGRKCLLVTELLNIEQATFRSNVDFPQVVYSVDDRGTSRSRNSVVVGFADSSDRGDVGLDEVVLSEVCMMTRERQ